MLRHFLQMLVLSSLLLTSACSSANTLQADTPTAEPAIPLTGQRTEETLNQEPSSAQSSTPKTVETAAPLEDSGASTEQSLFPEPNPIHLDLELNEDASAIMEIGYEGGSMSLTAPDGTVFTLQVPPEALFSPETVRMVPVTSAQGLPIEDAQVFAVQLEPEGLYFFRPVTLTIQSPAGFGTDTGEHVGFGTFADGKDFHLVPELTSEAGVEIPLTHFSSYGVIQARAEEIARIRENYVPTRTEAIAKDFMVAEMKNTENMETLADYLEDTLKSWFDLSVIENLEGAANNDTKIEWAIGEYMSWKDTVEIAFYWLGSPANEGFMDRFTDYHEMALDSMAVMLKNAFDNAYARCVQDNDPIEALKMLRWGLVSSHFQLWGREGFDQQQAQQKFGQCFNFEFVFKSRVEGDSSENDWTTQVAAEIPMEIAGTFDYYGGVISNTGDLEVEVFEFAPLPGECTRSPINGTARIAIQFDLNFRYTEPSIDKITAIFGVPLADRPQMLITCSGLTQDTPTWWPWFVTANKDFMQSDSTLKILLFIEQRGNVFAELVPEGDRPVYQEDGATVYESSTFQLVHKPSN